MSIRFINTFYKDVPKDLLLQHSPFFKSLLDDPKFAKSESVSADGKEVFFPLMDVGGRFAKMLIQKGIVKILDVSFFEPDQVKEVNCLIIKLGKCLSDDFDSRSWTCVGRDRYIKRFDIKWVIAEEDELEKNDFVLLSKSDGKMDTMLIPDNFCSILFPEHFEAKEYSLESETYKIHVFMSHKICIATIETKGKK